MIFRWFFIVKYKLVDNYFLLTKMSYKKERKNSYKFRVDMRCNLFGMCPWLVRDS